MTSEICGKSENRWVKGKMKIHPNRKISILHIINGPTFLAWLAVSGYVGQVN